MRTLMGVTSCLVASFVVARSGAQTPAADTSEPATTPAPSSSATSGPLPSSTPRASAEVEFRHAPPAAASTDEELAIHAQLIHPELVDEANLHYVTDDGKAGQATFRRSSSDDYVAAVPQAVLRGEVLRYWVTLRLVNGQERAGFASAAQPHRVQLVPTRLDLGERALLNRVDGRRNSFAASGEYVDFGRSEVQEVTAGGTVTHTVRDRYYRVEASYTYRPLRVVSEFSLRVGVVRGESPVPYQATSLGGEPLGERKDVGLNYGATGLRLRLSDWFYADGEVLASVTEVGFATGWGGSLLFGDPYGTKLVLGAEAIEVFGTRFWSRTEIALHPVVRIAPIIEVTNMPHANQYGVRLLGEVALHLGHGWITSLRGGYQARKFDSGGPGFGAGLTYEL
jgi:hypothetical protein